MATRKLSDMVKSDYVELSQDSAGLLRGGFGSVDSTNGTNAGLNNCSCTDANNCDCTAGNNCVCKESNNCKCPGGNACPDKGTTNPVTGTPLVPLTTLI